MEIQDEAKGFTQKLDDYKQMVILRQEECVQIADVLTDEARRLSVKVKRNKNALIILGIIVATKSALDLAMTGAGVRPGTMQILSFLFLFIGVIVTMISALDKSNRYEERTGELRALSTQCRSHDKRFMLDYKRYVEPDKPEITLARLEALIELQNESIDNIRQRCDILGVPLSTVSVSYRIDGRG
jgi:hypothetical protein